MSISAADPLAEFDYHLPPRLIARRPPKERHGGRLLDLTGENPIARMMLDLPALLRPGDALVVNDSRVMPARMTGAKKNGGGKVEILTERILASRRFSAQVRPARRLKPGAEVVLESGDVVRAAKRAGALWEFDSDIAASDLLRRAGRVPLPPYMERDADAEDAERYQTIFARREGSAAAPTAGLHFSEELKAAAERSGARVVALTLHVGGGTFAPIRGHPDDHRMHAEMFSIPEETAAAVRAAKKESRRVVAVGTTVLRALESSALQNGEARATTGETDLFIRPGFDFRTADLLLTNFHLPRSTLLMLACAFAGRERVLAGYNFAVENGFRFFSYGDATLLARA